MGARGAPSTERAKEPRGDRPVPIAGASTPERTALGALGLSLAAQIATRALESRSMAATILPAILVEWGARRLGVVFTQDDDAHDDAGVPARSVARRIVTGLGLGASAMVALAAFAWTTRAVAFERGSLAVPLVVMAIVTAGFDALRDELLLRGLVLRAMGPATSPLGQVAATGIVALGASLGQPNPTVVGSMLATVLGLFFGALWVRDRGAWLPWAAHVGWLLAHALLFGGGALRAHLAETPWGGGGQGILGGQVAVVAVLPLASWAIAWATLARPTRPRVR